MKYFNWEHGSPDLGLALDCTNRTCYSYDIPVSDFGAIEVLSRTKHEICDRGRDSDTFTNLTNQLQLIRDDPNQESHALTEY